MSQVVRKNVVPTQAAREVEPDRARQTGSLRETAARRRNLLIVEPERLLRWSLVTYLSRWFNVFPVESREEADRLLDKERIDAVVVSDELDEQGAGAVEQHAIQRNPAARVVHVVMSLRGAEPEAAPQSRIEKPFELAKLARLLGVHNGSTRSAGQ